MKDFEKEYYELVNISDRIADVKRKEDILNSELEKKCSDFTQKYNNKANVKALGGGTILNLFNRGVDKDQLMKLLTSEEEVKHIFSSDIFNTLKNHMSGQVYSNQLLNYNNEVIRQLEEKFSSLESVECDISINDLFIEKDRSGYLISPQLRYILKNSYKSNCKQRSSHKSNFFYMVSFNTITKNGKTYLVYNYRAYHKIFIELLYAYIILEQKSTLFQRKKGYIASDYLFVTDKELENKYSNLSKFDQYTKPASPELELSSNLWFNYIHLVKCYIKGEVIKKDYQGMSKLIKLLCEKNEAEILKSLNENISIEQVKVDIKGWKKEKIYNYITRFIFIVSDLNVFIESVKLINKDINLGPQKDRGSGSYISDILTNIDRGFRNSMYNHNNVFLYKYLDDKNERYNNYIPKSNFSYKNIHMNIGNIRWYSTVHCKFFARRSRPTLVLGYWIYLSQDDFVGITGFKYYSTYSEACFANKNLATPEKKKIGGFAANNIFLKRAIYNFIKAVIKNKISGVHFQDSTALITFLKEFDPDFKMSRQSIHNYRKRKVVFKNFLLNYDVLRFFAYVNSRFPEFNPTDFLGNCSGTRNPTTSSATQPN